MYFSIHFFQYKCIFFKAHFVIYLAFLKLNTKLNMKHFQLLQYSDVVSVSSGKAHQSDPVGGSAVVGAVGDVHGSLWARVVAAYKATAPPGGTRNLHAQSPQRRGSHIRGKTQLLGYIHCFLFDLIIRQNFILQSCSACYVLIIAITIVLTLNVTLTHVVIKPVLSWVSTL